MRPASVPRGFGSSVFAASLLWLLAASLPRFLAASLTRLAAPASYIPVSLVQNSIKLSMEQPKGLKTKLQRAFDKFKPNQLTSQTPESMRLIFSLSLFHAIIQERKKFGALGWNLPYEFNDSDLLSSIQMMQSFLLEKEIQFDVIQHFVGQINYGGIISNEQDQKLLQVMLNKFICSDILTPGYKFSRSGIYQTPFSTKIEDIKQYISNLPDADKPEIFGLHDNANLTFQIKETSQFLKALITIQPKESVIIKSNNEQATSENIVIEMCSHLESKIPAEILKATEAEAATLAKKAQVTLQMPLVAKQLAASQKGKGSPAHLLQNQSMHFTPQRGAQPPGSQTGQSLTSA